jgi:hypothetical protein
MTDEQRALLWRLILVYAEMQRDEVAVRDLERIRTEDLDGLTFAWAGGLARGDKHYYRIHGATFVIEYDNTQDDGNHVHTVWRDFERDFGGDPLRAHLEQQHGR